MGLSAALKNTATRAQHGGFAGRSALSQRLARPTTPLGTENDCPAVGFRRNSRQTACHLGNVCYDPVGGDVFDESTRCIAFGGRLLVVGFTSGRIATVSTNKPLIKGFSVVGVRAGEYGRRFPDKGRENQEAIWRLAEEGRIRPRVHAEIPLDHWREAFDAMQASAMVGKLVLVP